MTVSGSLRDPAQIYAQIVNVKKYLSFNDKISQTLSPLSGAWRRVTSGGRLFVGGTLRIFEGVKESKFVKTKIVAGYVLLVAVSILAIAYVYRAVVRFSTPDSDYALLHTKRMAVNRTLYHLYQAESYGQLMIAGYSSYENRYRSELRRVRGCIDSLRSLTVEGDSLQTLRLDSITRLLADKERRTMNLRQTIRAGSTAGLLDKSIRELIGPQTSIVADTTPFRRVVRRDTLAEARAKRPFLQRVAELFTPREDSSVVISRHEEIATMLPVGVVRDTIELVLRALQDSVTSNRLSIYDHAWQEGLRLSYSNDLVNTKIYSLILDFEAEDTALLMRRIRRSEGIRRRTSHILGGVTGGSILLMLFFVGVLWRDINRGNRYRRELERTNREKEALLAAREQLMLAITHDIKAPLGSVMGYIDLLSRLTDDKRQALYLHNMKDSSEHLLELVNSLLDFYRLDINKIEVHRVAFNPAQLFETIRAGFAASASAKGLELRFETGKGAARIVEGDAFHIRQIADNLMSNALKFTDKGWVTIRVDVVRGELIFSVRDTGRGIGREERERIFAEFVRLSSARGVDGFGLGLSIVDRLVKLLGGRISLESRPGEGSRFIVTVPVRETGETGTLAAPEAVPAAETPCPAEAPVAGGGVRVLLVDDDPLQLEMTAAMCRRSGVSVEGCQYPEYVGKLVAEGDFDLVLTDIQMPSADGFRVLEIVHEVDPGLPVVAVSARGELAVGDLRKRGFAGCLRKPFTSQELLAAIRAALPAGDVREEGPGSADAVRTPEAEPAAGAEPDGTELPLPGADEDGNGRPEAVDFRALTAYAGEDAEAARDILRTFVEQTTANCLEFEKALDAADMAAVKALAHRMLPIFTMLRIREVADVLRRIETDERPAAEGLPDEWRNLLVKIRAVVAEAEKNVSLQHDGANSDR